MNRPVIKWSPALPCRKPDNIISSTAKPAFKPSYENAAENMNFIMSNEYMRMWFKEKCVYEKDTYAREQIIKKERKIKRRMIQRMMTFRKLPKSHFIDDFVQKKMGRNKAKDPEEMKKKMKYKPTCPSQADQDKETLKLRAKSAKSIKDNEEDEGCCEIVVRPICRQNG